MLGPVAGYKSELTTAVMQQILGLNESIAGAIFATTVHQAPTTIHSTDYVHLVIDSEIAFQLGADLPADRAP
jgi:2-keto-4-pentenoate hydratase